MNDSLTEQAEEIFYSAVKIESPDERQLFVVRSCQGNDGLRSMVEKLLESQPGADQFFRDSGLARLPLEELSRSVADTPLFRENGDNPDDEDKAIGRMIGPYKLLQKIGEGGFGVVYMAEQERPVRRMVALKIIKPGMDSAQVLRRFEATRTPGETFATWVASAPEEDIK